jgi:hypothetical protein
LPATRIRNFESAIAVGPSTPSFVVNAASPRVDQKNCVFVSRRGRGPQKLKFNPASIFRIR